MTLVDNSEEVTKIPLDIGLQKRSKIRVELWDCSANPPAFIVAKETKYGNTSIRIKLGKTLKRYRISYIDPQGRPTMKPYGKKWLYQIDISNSVGIIQYFKYDKEKVIPKEAESMLSDGFDDVFIKKGGIPIWYVLIGIIGTVICAVAMAYFATQYVQFHDLAQQLANKYNADEQQILTLTKQLDSFKSQQTPATPPPSSGFH